MPSSPTSFPKGPSAPFTSRGLGEGRPTSKTEGAVIDGYIRVSQVAGRSGESFISAAVKREQIAAWARLRGALIGEIFEELDASGAKSYRPLLALARAAPAFGRGRAPHRRSLAREEAAIRCLVATPGDYPTYREFEAAGSPAGVDGSSRAELG